jgi:predicted metal-dependent HD superfamily phosphohydrolase
MYVAVFWHTTPESLATFQRNLLQAFTTLKKKPADSFQTLVANYHNAWRHNPTDSSLRCHSFHSNKYLSSAHSTSRDGGEGAEVFPIPNNA